MVELLIKYLKKVTVFLEKKLQETRSENNPSINTLAPKILTEQRDLERIKPYLTSLKQAIDTEGINNIALTGNYGSGKSTILKTFQHQNPEYKYLNISLASFKDNKEKVNDEEFERKVEISILQQIFYHVEPSVIPDSRFKRIINLTRRKLLTQAALLILWILSTLVLFKFNKIDKLNPETWSINFQLDWIALLSITIFFLGVGLFVKNILRLFSNSKINKFNIKGELELGDAIDKSVFNQHLEEILYFFERTDFNVVVIEDVDRFNSTDIFTKLREINILINNSNLIKRKVKFIYAIRDEMFTDKNERVKFFEFIIPIIPFINPSNANDQLEKLIKGAKLEDVLSLDFTSDVVTFIDDIDMRLLINIFHEFLIYRESLSKDLAQDNLFAIIVYKNMFPGDFGELAKRKGNLYKILSNRSLYIKDLVDEVKSQINSIDQQVALLESEIDKPIEELRAVYIIRLIQKLNNFRSFSVNDYQVSVVEALNDENFRAIKNSGNIPYWYHEYSNVRKTVSGITFSSVEKEISDLTYDQREKFLFDRSNNQIKRLKVEKEKLRSKVSEIEGLSIKEIFEQVDIEKYLGDFKENYLMRNLLLNGYIDEHYDDYISLFHEISLTSDDFAYERRVKSGISSEFDYSLTKTKKLLKRLPDKYFKREVIFNYDLIEYLLENKNKYKNKYDNLFKGLSVDGERQFKFIYGFVKRTSKEVNLFIKDLCIHKPTLWQYLNNKSGLLEEEVRMLLRLIFEFAEIDSILKFNEVETLVRFIEQMNDFFTFSSDLKNTETIKLFINEKKVLFERLDIPPNSRKNLFDYVYKNNLYRINEHNISIIMNYYDKSVDLKELDTAHYSMLLKSGLESLLSYISNNIEEYIENVMLMVEGNVAEHETTIIRILNREDISIQLKSKLIVSQLTIINSISKIDSNDVREVLLVNNKIKPTWTNVFAYIDAIEATDFDEPLITFLNTKENYLELSKRKLNDGNNKEDEYIEKISYKILHCNDLNIDTFSSLLNSIPYVYNRVEYQQLNTERIEVMLSEKKLTLTNDNFVGLKAKDKNLHIKLLENHQNKFAEDFSKLSLEANDWHLVFKSSNISLQNKLSIIKNLDDSIIIENHQVADIVCSILPANEYISLRFEVLDAMFKAHASIQKRIALLNLHFENLDDSQIQSLTEKLGEDYLKIFMKQHKPVFANYQYNITLFNKLKERDLIIRFEEVEKTNEIRVIAKYQ